MNYSHRLGIERREELQYFISEELSEIKQNDCIIWLNQRNSMQF